ncbi:MAG: ferritin family protein [Thermodesulforhabdaceae bacterium]
MYTPGEILNLAILIEENGESFYLDVAKLAKDPQTKLLLERLAREERIHRERFLELKREIDKAYKPDAVEKISRFLTAEAIGTRLFSLESQKVSSISSIEEAIQLAITLEEDSLIFYELLKSLSDRTDSIQILDRIISEEQSHMVTLKEIAKSL